MLQNHYIETFRDVSWKPLPSECPKTPQKRLLPQFITNSEYEVQSYRPSHKFLIAEGEVTLDYYDWKLNVRVASKVTGEPNLRMLGTKEILEKS